MNQENFLLWLKRTEVPLSKISKKTGVSRSTLYKWMEGGPIRKRNMEKVVKGYSTEITLYNETINLNSKNIDLGGSKNMEAQKIIDNQERLINYQEREIDGLKKENKTLKDNTYPIQSKEWNTLDFDFFSDVDITFLPFKRCVNKMTGDGVSQLAERLKLSEDHLLNEYFSIGKYHSFNKHPVDKIVAPNNLKELKKLSINMPNLFDSLKTMIGEHYFRQVIIYQHNDVVVPSLCYIKINWFSNPVNAKCKTKFFTD